MDSYTDLDEGERKVYLDPVHYYSAFFSLFPHASVCVSLCPRSSFILLLFWSKYFALKRQNRKYGHTFSIHVVWKEERNSLFDSILFRTQLLLPIRSVLAVCYSFCRIFVLYPLTWSWYVTLCTYCRQKEWEGNCWEFQRDPDERSDSDRQKDPLQRKGVLILWVKGVPHMREEGADTERLT